MGKKEQVPARAIFVRNFVTGVRSVTRGRKKSVGQPAVWGAHPWGGTRDCVSLSVSRRGSRARLAHRADRTCAVERPPHLAPHASLPTLSGISPPLLLADDSSPRMTDDYPSFGDSSLFGANVYYRGTVALGRTGLIPAAHVYEGGLRKVGMPGMSGD